MLPRPADQTPSADAVPTGALTSMANASGLAPRLSWLDGVRAVAALLVLLHHEYLNAYLDWGHPSGWPGRLTVWMPYGSIGVPIFIVVSGFALMQPVLGRGGGQLPNGVSTFARARVRRIVPPFLAVMLLTLVLDLTLFRHPAHSGWDATLPLSGRGWLTTTTLTANLLAAVGVDPGLTPNGTAYSVIIESYIYVLFPLLLLAFGWGAKRVSALLVAALVLVTLAATSARSPLWVARLGALHPELLALFVVGALAAVLVHTGRVAERHSRVLVAGATCIFGLGLLTSASLGRVAWYRHEPAMFLIFGSAAALFLVSLAVRPTGLAARILSRRPLVFLGQISYSVYLFHGIAVEGLWRLFVGQLSGQQTRLWTLVALTPVVLGTCWVFFKLVEEPCRPSRRAVRRTNPSDLRQSTVTAG